MNQNKKRLIARIIAAVLILTFVLALFSSMFRVNASAAAPAQQLQAYSNYKVVYVIGEKQIPIGADAIHFAVITLNNLNAIQADAAKPSNAGSGKVICGGIEMKLPKELYEVGGYVTDAYGNIMLSEAAIYNYLAAAFAPYTTVGKSRYFMSTAGELKVVGGGNYGAGIDIATETRNVVNAIVNHVTEARYPVWGQRAFGAPEGSALPLTYAEANPALGFLPIAGNALYDIGTTYVEVDLTNQMLYYYVNGAQTLATKVVTGDTRLRRGTPEGVFYLYAKQRNRTLKGADYEAFVRYWMPIYYAIGMHDASWRGSFGGTIYQRNGSHGCINMPTAAAKQLYEQIAIGTPVVVFY